MRRWLIILAVLAALFSGLRHLPLAWVAGALPANVGTATGTIWNGQLSQVPLLGRLSVQTGLGHVDVSTPGGATSLAARLAPGRVENLTLSLPLALLPIQDQRLQGVAGRVSLRLDEARYSGQQCESATGTAATNVLAVNAATLGWTGPDLSGPVDCVDGQVRVRLSGADNMASVEATVLIGGDGVYQSDITATVSDPNADAVLGLFGFSAVGANEYRLSEQGRWR